MLSRLPRSTLSSWATLSALPLSRVTYLATSASPLCSTSTAASNRAIAATHLFSASTRTLVQPATASNAPLGGRASQLPRRQFRDQVGERELPELKSRAPLYLALALVVTLGWGGFLAYATNAERANSSVVRSLGFQLRSWPAVREFLGDGVKIEPLFADFVRIKGSINMLAGKIDVQFRVRGSKGAGTASFTSIRRGKDGRFEVLRWKITRDDGAVLDLTGLDLTKPLEGLE
ncbi:hypothetical protein BMF94_3182 [Rhodotorula taiwanensis]|uniref:Uncharacterized protein n=1 Tax=Rhodotorula taiwanensis TaxID=741276 RepID=A0A2S5BA53_9BASI|nr:hypothetical protein BMF94_3182 [Rhodotorula taiwanensis]